MCCSSKVFKHLNAIIKLLYILSLLVFNNGSCLNNNNSCWLVDGLNDIFFRFYTSKNITQYVDVPYKQMNRLVSKLDFKKSTVIYLHGYLSNVESNDVIAVVSVYLQRSDHNVIAVDYRKISHKNYTDLVASADSTGKVIAAGINQLVTNGVSEKSIHIVGHSMGAQIAGYIGRNTNFKLTRITGLDPAGPNFNYPEVHLSISDAKFVDTIHTDAGMYGTSRMSGTVMFLVNKGVRVQPGCPMYYELLSEDDFCSHHRSWEFYAESLKQENSFIATHCTSSQKFFCGNCNNNKKIFMGFATPQNVKGVFYLKTRSQAPFGMGMQGAISNLGPN